MKHIIDWSKSHNGVMLCNFHQAITLMPEIEPILAELFVSGELELPVSEYAVDVKIHIAIFVCEQRISGKRDQIYRSWLYAEETTA